MSSIGQGSISFSQKQTGGGPPFAANAANNGLSVDPVSGKIVLGNNVGSTTGSLLSNRLIQMEGFSFSLKQTIGLLSTNLFQVDATNRLFSLGDFDFVFNGSNMQIDDVSQTIQLFIHGDLILLADRPNRKYEFGDTSGTDNGTKLLIDDLARVVKINTNGFEGLTIDFSAQTILLTCTNGLSVQGSNTLIISLTTLFNGAGAAAGTLNNSPAAGNPTKWIRIDDNGTIRFIPAW